MNQPIKKENGNEEAAGAEPEIDPALSSDEEDEAIDLGPNRSSPDEKDAQIVELREQLMRALAETENIRKRAQRDVEEANKFAVSGFARHLVSVLENLQRASESIPQELSAANPDVKNLKDGVDMTLRELLSVFEKFGITRIDPLGKKFDHNYHQAMTQIEDNTVEPGTVLQVMQAGYLIHDRLLQPALVAVSKKGEDNAQVDTQA